MVTVLVAKVHCPLRGTGENVEKSLNNPWLNEEQTPGRNCYWKPTLRYPVC